MEWNTKGSSAIILCVCRDVVAWKREVMSYICGTRERLSGRLSLSDSLPWMLMACLGNFSPLQPRQSRDKAETKSSHSSALSMEFFMDFYSVVTDGRRRR